MRLTILLAADYYFEIDHGTHFDDWADCSYVAELD